MKKIINIILLFSLSIFIAMKKDKPAYVIYSTKGKIVSYGHMLDEIKKADVIFFGEQHDNPISHWLQFELTRDLYNLNKGKIILGAEMIEADTQIIVDEYLKGLISQSKFLSNARVWKNHSTDYQPIVNFAKSKKIPFIATNVPGRYASIVFYKGFKGLEKISDEAKKYMAPLPIEFDSNLDSYKNISKHIGGKRSGHPSGNTAKAQALKDATMAYFINKNFVKGKKFIHINGAYHSDNSEGIIWHLKKLNNNLKIMNISSVSKKEVEIFDKKDKNRADFLIIVPNSMTRTY